MIHRVELGLTLLIQSIIKVRFSLLSRDFPTTFVLKPLTDVAYKRAILFAICSLQGVVRSCRKLLQLKLHVATIYVH